MSICLVAAVIAGCAHAPPAPEASAPTSKCQKAADQLVELMSAASAADPDSIKAITDKIVERCESDKWSEDTKTCLIGLRDKNELSRCESLFTPEQTADLVNAFGGPAPAPGGPVPASGAVGGGAPPAAAPAPSSTTRGAVPKDSKDTSKPKPSDPCEGGQ
jgi:hypothetical protein